MSKFGTPDDRMSFLVSLSTETYRGGNSNYHPSFFWNVQRCTIVSSEANLAQGAMSVQVRIVLYLFRVWFL